MGFIEEIDRDTRVPFFQLRTLDPIWANEIEGLTEQLPEMGFVTSKGGVITIDFNEEVKGKTLIFTITINNVKRE